MSTATETTPITVQVVMADFDDTEPYRVARDVPIKEFVPLTNEDFSPRGLTPLRDSTARFIGHLGQRQKEGVCTVGILIDRSGSMGSMRSAVIDGVNEFVGSLQGVSEVDPATSGKVLAVIVTDGGENASKETNPETLQALISQRETEGWTFIYLGANQDAWGTGQGMGLSGGVSGQSVNYAATDKGMRAALRTTAHTHGVGYLSDNDSYASSLAASGSSMRSITEDGEEVLANTGASPSIPTPPVAAPPTGKERVEADVESVSDVIKNATDYLRGKQEGES